MSLDNQLSDFCRWNDSILVEKFLNDFKNLNVLHENGEMFRFAISKNNLEICNNLLRYFNSVQFLTKDNSEYQNQKNKLCEVLEEAVEMYDISEEMKNILSPYVDFESSEDNRLNDSLFEDYHLQDQPYYEEDIKTPPIIKSKSMGYLNTDIDSSNEIVDILFSSQKEYLDEVHSSGDIIESNN